MKTVIETLAGRLQAMLNCATRGNGNGWERQHRDAIVAICKEYLPSGSGFDGGITLDIVRSKPNKIVLIAPYHRMSEHGYYCGWETYTVTVTPSFDGIEMRVAGGRRDDREYIGDTLHEALTSVCGFDVARHYASEVTQ